MSEKMDLTLYLIENGYEGNLEDLTLEEIRKIAVVFFGEDPTAYAVGPPAKKIKKLSKKC